MKDNFVHKDIFVGTSGYYFNDWAKNFYPRGLKRDLWLRYYTNFFNSLELNTTFYAIPDVRRMEEMAKKLPEEFNLHIKLPGTITHRRDVSTTEICSIMKNFSDAISPLVGKGIVAGYLAQFPVSFKLNDENLSSLLHIIKISPEPLFVEFRNKNWLDEKIIDIFRENNVGWVIPDAPQIHNLMPDEIIATSDVGYIRLHGRNEKNWYSKEEDRYDYFYSDEELEEIFKISEQLFHRGVKKVFVYFNNCHRGQAAINAKKFAELIGILPEENKLF